MKQPHFLYIDKNSMKLKSWLQTFWLSMVKNGCGQSSLWSLKLTLSEEWTDGIDCFFRCWYKLMQIKMCLKILGVSLVKNECGEGTLKLAVSEEWTDGITDYLHFDTDWKKLKADQNIFGWAWSKMSVASPVMGISNWLYLKNKQMESTDFLHAGINSGKLKIDSMIFRWVWPKMALTF